MGYTTPTPEGVESVLRVYKRQDPESIVRALLRQAENCMAGAKEGPGQFLWGIYGSGEKRNAQRRVELLPGQGEIWYHTAEEYAERYRDGGIDIDLEEIRKEFPLVEEIYGEKIK